MRRPSPASIWSISVLMLIHLALIQAKDDKHDQVVAIGAIQWPAHLKYFPEDHIDDNTIRRRDREAVDLVIRDGATPMEVRKMSDDESEMFFPEYWGFSASGSPYTQPFKRDENDKVRRDYEDEEALAVNASAVIPFRPAFNIHEASLPPHDGRRALAALQRRAFTCPSGTGACSSIGQENYCCGISEDCFIIVDTGLGPVGCCPRGVSCAGEITTCNLEAGQTPCPQDLGGACCVAGFSCFDVGCVSGISVNPTVTMPAPPPVPTVTVPTTTPSPPGTTLPPTLTPPVVVPPPVTRQTDLPCNGFPSFFSCAPQIGGCCLSGRLCAPGSLCLAPGETITPLPPVRGTEISTSLTITTPPAPGTTVVPAPVPVPPPDYCPTGFYACSARYPGAGCCRIGRDCASTFCPETPSVTIVTDGRTVVVPYVPAATTTAVGNCANGWTGCPAEVGGLCCPSGWVCGTASCTGIAASATREVGKGQPIGAGGRLKIDMRMFGGVVVVGVLVLDLVW